VRLLALWIAAANVWRAVLVLRQFTALPGLELAQDPRLLAFTCGVWAVIFLALAVQLLRARGGPAIGRFTMLGMLLYQAHVWLDVAVFGRASAVFATLGFRALLSGLAIAVTALLVWRMRRPRTVIDTEPS
jgi:hypothetical protein